MFCKIPESFTNHKQLVTLLLLGVKINSITPMQPYLFAMVSLLKWW